MKDLLTLDAGDYNESYLEPGFIRTLRDHKDHLLSLSSTQTISVEPSQSYRWRGDLYGLLKDNNVPVDYRLAVCIVNGLASYSDWDGETDIIYVPATAEIDRLFTLYQTTQK